MERLTEYTHIASVLVGDLKVGVDEQKAFDRLAAYEDTGLEPEEITAIKHVLMGQEVAKILEFDGIPIQRLQELAQAEKDGLLVVTPCKEGDPVWWVDVDWTPGDGKIFYKITTGKFRYAMLDWQNPVFTSQAAAEEALAELDRRIGGNDETD